MNKAKELVKVQFDTHINKNKGKYLIPISEGNARKLYLRNNHNLVSVSISRYVDIKQYEREIKIHSKTHKRRIGEGVKKTYKQNILKKENKH